MYYHLIITNKSKYLTIIYQKKKKYTKKKDFFFGLKDIRYIYKCRLIAYYKIAKYYMDLI